MKKVNLVKKEVTRFRRESTRFSGRKVPLFQMLINVRSNFSYTYDWQTDGQTLFGLIASLKNQHREYGVRRAIIERYGADCFKQSDHRKRYGKRTVFENGQWKSSYTEIEEMPF